MHPGLESNKAFAFALLIGALVLLGLSTAGLDGQLLSMGETGRPAQVERGAAVDRFGTLFAAEPIARLARGEKRRDVFATTHFDKPPPPPAGPPAPKTRSVTLTYLGTLSGSNGELSAFLRVDQAVLKLTAGSKIVHDWMLAKADGASLVLTNATQTNQLAFRQSLQLTVPLP
jgi:hypothetical protein